MGYAFVSTFGQFPVSLRPEAVNMKLNEWYLKRGLVHWMVNVLSYLMPVLLDRGTDPVHGELLLHVRKGRHMLGTRDTLYSWDDQYMNFVWALEKVDFSAWQRPRILLIGVGLGSVPYILEKRFRQPFVMDGVEIHPLAVRWAKKYTLPVLTQPVTLHTGDGVAFVQDALKSGNTYDLVIVDVCVEDRVPVEMERREFLEALHTLLESGGGIMFNRFYSTFKDQFRTDRFYLQVFRKGFASTELLDFSGTAVLVGYKTGNKSEGNYDKPNKS
jgi:hypothetical protein